MHGNYQGLPAAASVAQAIALAQLIIARDLARRAAAIPAPANQGDPSRMAEHADD